MRIAKVYRNGLLAGTLTQYNTRSYEFRYEDDWFADDSKPAISLTLPKSHQTYKANHLFPFFFNMLSEGANKQLQCRQLKIDESDYYGILVATATVDTSGAVTVESIESK